MSISNNVKEESIFKNKENMKDRNFQDANNNLKTNIIRIIKGSILAIIISAIFLTIFAILLTYTNLSENSITPVVLTIVGLSILMGSYLSSRKISQNGIINGAIVSIIYIVSSMVLMDFSLGANSLMMIACGIIAGIIGGIVGVNTNKN